MTVSSPVAKAVHITHEAVTDYAFPFKVFKEQELAVCLVGASSRVIPLVPGLDYTASGLGRDQGGNIALTPAGREAAGTGLSLVLLRRMDFTQETDYRPHDVFPAETHERALDILTMICQELREMVGRAMIAPPNVDEAVQYADFVNLLAAAEAAVSRARGEADRSEAAAVQARAAKARARYWSTLARKWAARAAQSAVEAAVSGAGRDFVYPSMFFDFMELEPPAGWRVRGGGLLVEADIDFPGLYDYLGRPENAWKCKAEPEWQALSALAGGVGGVPFFVLDTAAKTIRLPDTRGDYTRGAGGGTMAAVGDWHQDAIRNITGRLVAWHSGFNPSSDGVFAVEGPYGTVTAGTSTRDVPWYADFDASRVVPAAAENRTRAFGLLPCVYVGGD